MFWKRPKPEAHPEWLIVGLGNPGPEYRGTRHNLGFDVIDLLAERSHIRLDRSKHRARIGHGTLGNASVLLVKPLTYMNLSGQSVAPLARDYSIAPSHILVFADDMDLPLGKLRLRESGSAGGHNGHKSLIQYLKSTSYLRIRIGIGKEGSAIEHVLGGFSPPERAVVDLALDTAARATVELIDRGPQAAQTLIEEFNRNQG